MGLALDTDMHVDVAGKSTTTSLGKLSVEVHNYSKSTQNGWDLTHMYAVNVWDLLAPNHLHYLGLITMYFQVYLD